MTVMTAFTLGAFWSIICFGQTAKFLNWNRGWRQAAATGHPEAAPELVQQKIRNNLNDAKRWSSAGIPGLVLLGVSGLMVFRVFRPQSGIVRVSSRYRVKTESPPPPPLASEPSSES